VGARFGSLAFKDRWKEILRRCTFEVVHSLFTCIIYVKAYKNKLAKFFSLWEAEKRFYTYCNCKTKILTGGRIRTSFQIQTIL
jgi:hypothetical protein